MTKREIVFMCCRLIAVYLFLNSIFQLMDFLMPHRYGISLSSSDYSGNKSFYVNINGAEVTRDQIALFFLFTLIPTIFNWIVALGFWFGARILANRIFKDVPEEIESGPTLSIETEVRHVAFAIVGLFFLMQDLPGVMLWLLEHAWRFVRWNQAARVPFVDDFIWSWLIRVPISLWLVFGLRGLAGLWRLAQQKGIAPKG